MSTLSVWQRHIVDETGDVQPLASVGVKLADTATDASLFEDENGTTPISNPFTADVTGFAQFYVDNGEYDIYVGGVKKWSHVQLYRFDGIIAPIIEMATALINTQSIVIQHHAFEE